MISTQTNLRDLSYTFEYDEDLAETMEKAGIGERLQSLIIMRYGLNDGVPKTYDQIGRVHGISIDRAKSLLTLGIEMLQYFEETGKVKPKEIERGKVRPKPKDPKWQNCVYLKIRLNDDSSMVKLKEKVESLLDFPEIMELSWKERGNGTKWERSLTYKGEN